MPTQEEVSKELCAKFNELVDEIRKKYELSPIETSQILGITLSPILGVSIVNIIISLDGRMKLLDLIYQESKEFIKYISKQEMN